jgi:hypothetical protein
MTKLGLALLAAASVLLGSLPVLATQLVSKASRSLTLRIDDHAQLHPFIVRLAQKPVGRIFRQIGLDVSWLDCPTSARQFPTNLACQAPLGPADFVVLILPESMSKKYGLPKDVFGYTLPTTKGRVGRTVNVFYGRVYDMAFYGPVGVAFENAQGIILGHLIAHEIGHILLGPGSHSEKGIMSFPWGRKRLVDASRGGLQFTPEQARKILSKLDDLFAEGGDSVEDDH